jgi:hypothetical protein
VDECRDENQAGPTIVADALIVRYIFPAVLKMNYAGVITARSSSGTPRTTNCEVPARTRLAAGRA